jgi:transcriptional antiterminator
MVNSFFGYFCHLHKILDILNNGASSPLRELAALIERAARESLKIYYSQPNIPSRMAEIVLVLRERKKLSLAQMQQFTGVSRNSLVRDIKVLKLLGWLEFYGSRKNGYFTLTASWPSFLNQKESG